MEKQRRRRHYSSKAAASWRQEVTFRARKSEPYFPLRPIWTSTNRKRIRNSSSKWMIPVSLIPEPGRKPFGTKEWRVYTCLPSCRRMEEDSNAFWQSRFRFSEGWQLSPTFTWFRFVRLENAVWIRPPSVTTRYPVILLTTNPLKNHLNRRKRNDIVRLICKRKNFIIKYVQKSASF